ncbi:MAG TPA: C4-type zinc ribbon domain-containing protein [Chloroflexota bacterium]|nr:C4-type zinc ribbon domain-containing protein [Chloroflexota bacterium]
MEPAQLLYDLQDLDLRILADGAKLEAERAKIKEPPAVRQARATLKSLEDQLAGLQKQIRSTEQEVETVNAKKAAVHAKLYGGSVTVPRELAALETEEGGLARSLAQLEDRELELMASADETEKSLRTAKLRLDEELDRWKRQGSEAHEHIDQLDAEVQRLRSEREALAAQIAPANLALYDRLRLHKANRPVALVHNNVCQACGVALPSRNVQRARGADPPATCDNCGRLLLVR